MLYVNEVHVHALIDGVKYVCCGLICVALCIILYMGAVMLYVNEVLSCSCFD